METIWRETLWEQLGAAIDMLDNAIVACPEEVWGDRSRRPEFWYLVYHTLFFLDLYLHGSEEGFVPPEPFTLDELDPAGILPERVYTQDEMRAYLRHCREKCWRTIDALTEERARKRHEFEWVEMNGLELLLCSLRHVQHHTAQLNLLLRQTIDSAPRWVGRAKSP